MGKTVLVKRKLDHADGFANHYLRYIKNKSELEETISSAITDANFPYSSKFMVAEGPDVMWDSDYVVLAYNKKNSAFIDFFLYKFEIQNIFEKKISLRRVAEVDGEPLSSLFSGHQDKIEF